MRAAALVAVAAACALAGCAVRHDASGTSRVGVFLWGFGDPPGVNWDLDPPRSDVPDLPVPQRSELPPRREPPRLDLPPRRETEPRADAMEDNPAREKRNAPDPPAAPAALRARVGDGARG